MIAGITYADGAYDEIDGVTDLDFEKNAMAYILIGKTDEDKLKKVLISSSRVNTLTLVETDEEKETRENKISEEKNEKSVDSQDEA